MHAQKLFLSLAFTFSAALAFTACGDDATETRGTGGTDGGGVNVSGACGVICDGELMCIVEGVDPSAGLVPCVQACQESWPNEQSCRGPAEDLLICVDANGSCDTIDEATCGDVPSGWLRALKDCLAGN
jgi:hypothetical protein